MTRVRPGNWMSSARGSGGRRTFRAGDLDALTSRGAEGGRAVGSACVSSRRQRAEGDLERQVARLRESGGAGMSVFTGEAGRDAA